MFVGEYERSIDNKGRITLPARFREELDDGGAVITRGLDHCLFLFPRSYFEEWRQAIRSLPITDPHSRAFRRHIFSGAANINVDGQGRINLPLFLRRYAGLDGNVVITGNDDYVELWDAQEWAQTRDQFEAIAADAEAWNTLGI